MISLFLISLLLFKGTGILLTVFPSAFKSLAVAELLLESEQEKKGNARGETAPDELFEKALLPADGFPLMAPAAEPWAGTDESLPDVYLDTLTPPPNTAC